MYLLNVLGPKGVRMTELFETILRNLDTKRLLFNLMHSKMSRYFGVQITEVQVSDLPLYHQYLVNTDTERKN